MRSDVRAYIALAAVATSCGRVPAAPALPTEATSAPPPNFVVLVTDDLDAETAEDLPRLEALVAGQGLRFGRAFAAQSVCAPSRVSLLTGRYPHNHGVLDNTGPVGGFPRFKRSGGEAATIATWLRAAGYRTALVGKYLNGYPSRDDQAYIPPGWDEWYGHLSAFSSDRYLNYTLNENGRLVDYGRADADYATDVLTGKAVEVIRRAAALDRPLFLYLAPDAPHVPAISASRHAALFPNAEARRVPSFNEGDVRDKPAWIRNTEIMGPRAINRLDRLARSRLCTMSAVEEMIEEVLAALAQNAMLDRTYVIITSDNGLMMGQHRLNAIKGASYEESIRVPLAVRGPGIGPGRREDRLVVNVDLAPTLAELAGITPPVEVDGRSLVPLLEGDPASHWPDDVLVEHFSIHGVTSTLRTGLHSYTELDSGERELYDLALDPFQLDSRHLTADPGLRGELARTLAARSRCHGTGCRN